MSRRVVAAVGLAAALIGGAVPVGLVDARNSDVPARAGDAVAVLQGEDGESLDQIRDATRRFRDVTKAVDAGYVQFFGCVHEPLAGSMGIHFVNGARASDAVIDATTPEALLYEVKPNGLGLVGVEYVVFQAAWDAENAEPPSLFGQTFTLVPSPNRYGLDPFYELHAWAWKPNPTGSFQSWNPQVLCPGTEGHVQ
jgi:hypothetical protein